MADFFDKIANLRAAASAPIKADIDSLINQIDAVKQNLASAKTDEQIDTAVKNAEYYRDRAKRYKTTKLYADTVDNIAENKKILYNDFETTLQLADSYLMQDEYMDEVKEWQNLDSLAKKKVNGRTGKNYSSTMDFIVAEGDKITRWLNKLSPLDESGNRKLTGFKYNKNKFGGDDDIITQLTKYNKRLGVAFEALLGDGVITLEEAQLILMGDTTKYNKIKDAKVAEAVDSIKSNQRNIKSFEEDLLKLAQDDFTQFLTMINQKPELSENLDINISDNQSDVIGKLKKLLREQGTELELAEKKYKDWTGTNYLQTADGQDGDSLIDFAGDDMDEKKVILDPSPDITEDEQAAIDDAKPISEQYGVEEVNVEKIKSNIPEKNKFAESKVENVAKETNQIKSDIDNFQLGGEKKSSLAKGTFYDTAGISELLKMKYGKVDEYNQEESTLSYDDLMSLKSEFEKDALEYQTNLDEIDRIKRIKLDSPSAKKEIKRLRKLKIQFEKKWSTQSTNLLSSTGEWKSIDTGFALQSKKKHGAGGAASQLSQAFKVLESLVQQHKDKKSELSQLVVDTSK